MINSKEQHTTTTPMATTPMASNGQTVRNNTQGTGNGDTHDIKDRYNFHDASFRRHYQLHYHQLAEQQGQTTSDDTPDYETFYAPAYRFGYELAAEYAGADWSAVEEKAKAHWQSQHGSPWAKVVDAVRYGWEEQRHPEQLRVHHQQEYAAYQKSFYSHYTDAIGENATAFEQIEPAYRYGYDLAVDPAYTTHLWDEMEPEVRRYYEDEYAEGEVPWEDYRDAVHHAWYGTRTGGI